MNEQVLQKSLSLMGLDFDLKTADIIYNVSRALYENGDFGVVESVALKGVIEQKYENIGEGWKEMERVAQGMCIHQVYCKSFAPDPLMTEAREKVEQSIKNTEKNEE